MKNACLRNVEIKSITVVSRLLQMKFTCIAFQKWKYASTTWWTRPALSGHRNPGHVADLKKRLIWNEIALQLNLHIKASWFKGTGSPHRLRFCWYVLIHRGNTLDFNGGSGHSYFWQALLYIKKDIQDFGTEKSLKNLGPAEPRILPRGKFRQCEHWKSVLYLYPWCTSCR